MDEHPAAAFAVARPPSEAQPIGVFEKHARADDGVVLELERRQVDLTARERHQVLKRRALAGKRHARVGPVELAQQRRRVENVLRRSLRPLAFDQADEKHLVEFAVTRCLRVEKLHAAVPARGANVCPSIHRRIMAATFDKLDRRIVQVLMRPPQPVNGREHRAARPQVPLAQRIAAIAECDRACRETPAARRAAPMAVRLRSARAISSAAIAAARAAFHRSNALTDRSTPPK